MKNYSILGIDIGNATTKSSTGVIFDSKITKKEPLFTTDKIVIDKETYFLGEGDFDITYRKVDKQNYLPLLFAAISLSADNIYNKIMVGLPISQYKEDKSKLINMVINNRVKEIEINGVRKEIVIDDVEVAPEGIATLDYDFEGIVVDIGGRSTDCALIEIIRGKRKIFNAISIATGTINLYTEFINLLNKKYGLDLNLRDAERILTRGLILDGKSIKTDFALEVFKDFVENLISRLQVEYSLRTNLISLTGGGAPMFYKPIKNRLGDSVSLQDNSIFANANAYYELGCSLWL